MAAQRVGPAHWREQRLEGLPKDINHFRFQGAHDVGEVLPRVVGVGTHPASKPGQPDDQWMVKPAATHRRGSITLRLSARALSLGARLPRRGKEQVGEVVGECPEDADTDDDHDRTDYAFSPRVG